MMIDLDSFKLVNDIYGHGMGDKVLIACAGIIKNAVPAGSRCGRIGGDEFIVLAKNYTEEKALQFIENVRTVINQKVMLDGKEFDVGFSSGIHVEYPDDSADGDAHKVFEHCLKEADQSMYSEKRQHKTGRSAK